MSVRVYFLAFIVGLCADIWTGKLLGQTATFLLLICGVIDLFKTRFEFKIWKTLHF